VNVGDVGEENLDRPEERADGFPEAAETGLRLRVLAIDDVDEERDRDERVIARAVWIRRT
jgi:hypothetical protein